MSGEKWRFFFKGYEGAKEYNKCEDDSDGDD